MKQMNGVLKIEKAKALELEAILEIDSFDDSHDELKGMTLFSTSFTFEDGVKCEIRVCTGQNNAWVDSCWFNPTTNIWMDSEPSETLLGECTLEANDKMYLLEVVSE